jgi:hypothetical protein
MRHRKIVGEDAWNFRIVYIATIVRFRVLRFSKYVLYGLPDTLELCPIIKCENYRVTVL